MDHQFRCVLPRSRRRRRLLLTAVQMVSIRVRCRAPFLCLAAALFASRDVRLKRRIRQADKPGDLDLIGKQIESLNVPEAWKESLRGYMKERQLSMQTAKN